METTLQTLITYSAVVLLLVTGVFLLSQWRRDNSLMDSANGAIYAIATWTTYFIIETYTLVATLTAILVTLWAVRLTLRIVRKNWGTPEDARYAAWREKWTERGRIYCILRSYLQVNILPGLIIVIVSTPVLLLLATDISGIPYLIMPGIIVFVIGLIIETAADWQLDAFIDRKKAGTESATLMKTGLFAYSRRPNYFGESLIWWGFALIALPTSFWYLAFVSPMLITFILTKATGPRLEAVFLEKYPEAYRQYMIETNYFIPGKPNRQ